MWSIVCLLRTSKKYGMSQKSRIRGTNLGFNDPNLILEFEETSECLKGILTKDDGSSNMSIRQRGSICMRNNRISGV